MTEGGCSESEPFALQVLGDSMAPEFYDGCIVIIDPAGLVEDGSYVFASYKDEYIFRQLKIVDTQHVLCALNPEYPELKISGLNEIHGVIVQRAGKRRSEHKHYV